VSATEKRYCYRHPDRETGLSCSECERPICYECMTPAPVGIRCPEHSGKPQGLQRVTQTARRATTDSYGGYVTKVLVALNVGIFLAELALGGTFQGTGNRIYEEGVLVTSAVNSAGEIVGVSHGDWWRLLTAAFLHYGPIHLGMNMLALWWFGQPLEHTLGRARFLLLYLASGLAGSAGALVMSPNAATVGASGAIFGILGAALVLERQGNMVFGGQAMTMIVINLVFTFAVGLRGPISIGGHLGGLAGGVLCMLALTHFRRQSALAVASMVAVGAASVVIAYWKARGYA
jgi:membrane associated rhomboid family serine protease